MYPFSTKTGRLLAVCAACLFCLPLFSQVLINEYSAANLSTEPDEYGKHEDWIELYNAGPAAVNLTGYFLSDNEANLQKWPFPAGTILPAYSFLLLHASGRNIGFHTNFKLTQTKSDAEHLVLSDPSGTVLDEVTMKKTQANQSRGRVLNGGADWGIFKVPSPELSNELQTAYSAYANRPDFDVPPGFYQDSVVVTLTNNEPGATIRYTLNGKPPKANSPVYTGPITIKQTSVLKAVAFSADPGVLPGFMEFGTYFINEHHTLVVVSIAGDQLDALANGNGNLVPEGSVEYFDKNGERKARSYGQYNRHGQDSWVNDQRSMDLVCRDEMGYSKGLKEKIFALSDRDEFQRLILRAGGDDNYPGNFLPQHTGCAHMRDAYVQNLAKRGNLHLDVRISEKAVLYLNGKYWGVYDLREIPDDHDYTEYYYGQDKYDLQYILTWGSTWAEYGGQQAFDDWQPLQDFVLHNDMTDQAHFDYVASQIDLESLVDYVIVNSLSVCSDWLNWNTGWWRGLNPNGQHKKWGYILWDNDATFGYYINYTGIADTAATADPCNVEQLAGTEIQNYPGSSQVITDTLQYGGHIYYPGDTLVIPPGWFYTGAGPDNNDHMTMLLKLRQNPAFNQYYISRYIDLMNTVFSCDNMLSYLDTIANTIDPEMTRQAQRWGGSYDDWRKNVERLRFFIERRCEAQFTGLAGCHDLTGPYNVTFVTDPPGIAPIKVNSLILNDLPYTGKYFGDINVQVQAPASAGGNYGFENWSVAGGGFLQDPNVPSTLLLVGDVDTVTAHFQIVSGVKNPTGTAQVEVLAYPTLFCEQLTVEFELPNAAPVSIALYTADGRRVATLAGGVQKAPGRYTLTLEGPGLPAGVYVLQFQAGDFRKSLKVVSAGN